MVRIISIIILIPLIKKIIKKILSIFFSNFKNKYLENLTKFININDEYNEFLSMNNNKHNFDYINLICY